MMIRLLIEESDLVVRRSGKVFGDVVVVTLVGVQVSDVVCVAVLPRQTTSVTNDN